MSEADEIAADFLAEALRLRSSPAHVATNKDLGRQLHEKLRGDDEPPT